MEIDWSSARYGVYQQAGVTINYAYIGLTDANASDFVWLDGNANNYNNLSGKCLPLYLSLSVSLIMAHCSG